MLDMFDSLIDSGARGPPRGAPGLNRRRSLSLPPGFAHAFDTFTEEATGVTFQSGYEGTSHYQPPKVLRYEPSRLFYTTSSWRALVKGSPTRAATAVDGLFMRILLFTAEQSRHLYQMPCHGKVSAIGTSLGQVSRFRGWRISTA